MCRLDTSFLADPDKAIEARLLEAFNRGTALGWANGYRTACEEMGVEGDPRSREFHRGYAQGVAIGAKNG